MRRQKGPKISKPRLLWWGTASFFIICPSTIPVTTSHNLVSIRTGCPWVANEIRKIKLARWQRRAWENLMYTLHMQKDEFHSHHCFVAWQLAIEMTIYYDCTVWGADIMFSFLLGTCRVLFLLTYGMVRLYVVEKLSETLVNFYCCFFFSHGLWTRQGVWM